MTRKDYKPLLDAFNPDASRPAARRASRRGEYRIPERCRLPDLETLLRIDQAAEAAAAEAQRAIAGAGVDAGERGAVKATGEPHGGCGPHRA